MCGNNMHVMQIAGYCMCGYWKNGVANKSRFWQECVLAMLRSGRNHAEEINHVADEIESLSFYLRYWIDPS